MARDSAEYWRRRREFIAQRGHNHPMLTATTVIFTVTWLFGWGCSTLLLYAGTGSMPVRCALRFLASYVVVFLCVRVWCNAVHDNRQAADPHGGFDLGGGDEGCFVLLLIALAAFAVAALFWATGGFGALLDVAFEVAFAGTEIVGHWARTPFANTWLHALITLLLLASGAAALQRAAPAAEKFSEAVYTRWAKRAAR